MTRAVLFDVDFTLIYPGPTFRGEGYRSFCERHGVDVDVTVFDDAVASAATLLDGPGDMYDAELFVAYARHIIEYMGGSGTGVDASAREIYDEWAVCHHFHLYEEVPRILRQLVQADIKIGLLSNSHRCLASFQSHFELDGLIAAALSGPQHGFMKPNPSIFRAALQLLDVQPFQATMVGDSMKQDIEGALAVGMQGVLVQRSSAAPNGVPALGATGVPVIGSLAELPRTLGLPLY